MVKSLNIVKANEYNFVDMKRTVARLCANLLCANGFEFHSTGAFDLTEAFAELDRKNNLLDLIWSGAYNNALDGKSIIKIDRDLDGNVVISQPDYLGKCEFACDNVDNPIVAVLKDIQKNNKSNVLVERVYTPNKTFVSQGELDGTASTVGTPKIKTNTVLKNVDNHNLGVCPIVLVKNLPISITSSFRLNLPVVFNDANLTRIGEKIQGYQYMGDFAFIENIDALINNGFINYFKEMEYSRTKLSVNGRKNKNALTDNEKEMLKTDLITNYGNGKDDTELSAIQNQNKLVELQSARENDFETFCNLAGYSYWSLTGGNNKQSGEAEQSQMLTNLTIKTKTQIWNRAMWKILDIAFKLMGFSNYDFIFKLNGNSNENLATTTDAITKQLQMGALTKAQAVSKLNGTSLEQSQDFVDKNKKELEENSQQGEAKDNLGNQINKKGAKK